MKKIILLSLMFFSNINLGAFSLTQYSSGAFGSTVNEVRWAYGGAFLATVGGTTNEIKVYPFSGFTLGTPIQSTVGSTNFSCDWSLDANLLFVTGANSGGANVFALAFNGIVLTPAGTVEVAGGSTMVELKFRPPFYNTPYYIAVVGPAATSSLNLYSYTGGVFTAAPGGDTTHNQTLNSCSWSPDGNFLVVGGVQSTTNGNCQVRVFGYNGTTLTELTGCRTVIGTTTINSVVFSPDGGYVAVSGTADTDGSTTKIYSFSSSGLGSLTELPSCRQSNGATVNHLSWSVNNYFVTVGNSNTAAGETRVYHFYPTQQVTVEVIGTNMEHGANLNSVHWSPDQRYIAVGGVSGGSPTATHRVYSGQILTQGGFAEKDLVLDPILVGLNGYNTTTLSEYSFSHVTNDNFDICNSAAKLVLQDCAFDIADTFTFRGGRIRFVGDNYIRGQDDARFVLNNTSCFIATRSKLILEPGTFLDVYPSSSVATFFSFEDESSQIVLQDGSTLTVSNGYGISLLNGSLSIDGDATISNLYSDTMKALFLGGGGNDCVLKVNSGEILNISDGTLVNRNIMPGNLNFSGGMAGFNLQNGGKISTEKNIDFDGKAAPFNFAASFTRSAKGNLSSINTTTLFTVDHGATVTSLQWSNDGSYLAAVGDASGGGVCGRVYNFQITSFTELSPARIIVPGSPTLQHVVWSPDVRWLSTAGAADTNGYSTHNYGFDGTRITTTLWGGQKNFAPSLNSVDWSAGGLYWNVAGNRNNGFFNIQTFVFNGKGWAEEVTNSFTDFGANVNSLSWRVGSLQFAAGGAASGSASTNVRVYNFDEGLTEIPTARQSHGGTVYALTFNSCGKLLAIGGASGTGGYNIRVYQFDGINLNILTGCNIAHGANIYSLKWSEDCNYLVVGGAPGSSADGASIRIFQFDGTSLTEIIGARIFTGGTDIYSVDIHPSSLYIAAAGARIAGSSATTWVFSLNYAYDTSNVVIKNGIVNLSNDSNMIDQLVTFSDMKVLGNNYLLTMNSGNIVAESNSTLSIYNLTLNQVKNNNLRCNDNKSLIYLEHSNLNVSSNFTLTEGAMLFYRDIFISGTNQFTLHTTETSRILSASDVTFNYGMTFSYDPRGPFKNLLEFEDQTSRLRFDNCTLHTTSTGMQLTRGDIHIIGNVNFVNEGSVKAEGIILGDGSAINDPEIDIYPGSVANISGAFVYNGI